MRVSKIQPSSCRRQVQLHLVRSAAISKGPDDELLSVGRVRWTRRKCRQAWRKHLKTTCPIPDVRSPEFQLWFASQLDEEATKASYVALPGGHGHLTGLLDLAAQGVDIPKAPADLQAHQAVVYAMAQLRSRTYDCLTPDKPGIATPGLLAVHSTGAGKTLEGLCVILAFWNKQAARDVWGIAHLSVASNQESNDMARLAQYALRHFPDFHSTVGGDIPARPFSRGTTVAQAVRHMSARFLRGLTTMATSLQAYRNLKALDRHRHLGTFAKLGNDLEAGRVQLHQTVTIIDEVQFLLHPPPDELGHARQYAAVLHALTHRSSDSWVCCMSATPARTATDLRCVLNVVAGSTTAFTASTNLVAAARGLVSYAQVQGDMRHYPRLFLQPVKVRIDPDDPFCRLYLDVATGNQSLRDRLAEEYDVESPQEERNANRLALYNRQVAAFPAKLDRWKALRAEVGEAFREREPQPPVWRPSEVDWTQDPCWTFFDDSPGKYYKRLREASTVQLVRPPEGDLLRVQLEHDKALITTDGTRHNFLTVIGPKLRALTNRIAASAGKHFVYSSVSITVNVICFLLETELGMKRLSFQRGEPAYTPGSQHFLVIDSTPSTRVFSDFEYRLGHDIPRRISTLAAGRKAFNDPRNADGGLIKVIVASKDSYKGVDFCGLRYIHLLESMVSFADMKQLVGRGPRFGSHSQLPKDEWTVTFHPYWLTVGDGDGPPEVQVDRFVYQQSVDRYARDGGVSLEDDLQRASVDRLLFRDNFHRQVDQQRRDLFGLSV